MQENMFFCHRFDRLNEKKMNEKKDFKKKKDSDYEEGLRKKLDKIIEQTSTENSALKKILESLDELNPKKKKTNK